MLASVPTSTHASLTLIEASITAVAVGLSYIWPRMGSVWFRRVEQAFARVARRKILSVFLVGITALLARLALLPLCPIPLPFVADDFSFMLAADTFLHGRLTNPTPVMWTHFETVHVTMTPSYMSMYFPAQALTMAAGKLLFGHPWFGILMTSALMCAAICWMLQAWLPASWAFLGGMIAVLHLGLFSYWINSYHSAGAIGALGGALILGALPRALRTAQSRYWILLSTGIAILALSRPFEALLLCLPVSAVLIHWIFTGKNRPAPQTLMRRAVLPVTVLVTALGWLGYYDIRAFGKASTLPYTVDRAQYAMAPYFVWQHERPEPLYRHAELRRFYYEAENEFFYKVHSASGYLPQTILKATFTILFYAGVVLLIPLIMIRRVFLDRRVRFLVWCVCIMSAGMAIQIFIIPHYVAAFTGAFYAIGLQAMRHLRQWKPEGRPMGLMLVRVTVPILLVMAGLRAMNTQLHIPIDQWPSGRWNFRWYGPDQFGKARARVAQSLEQMPGQQLVFVRYGAKHNPIDEWVYNEPEIDSSHVIWAQDMGAAKNEELLRYYPRRHAWLALPDAPGAMLVPYSAENETNAIDTNWMIAKDTRAEARQIPGQKDGGQ